MSLKMLKIVSHELVFFSLEAKVYALGDLFLIRCFIFLNVQAKTCISSAASTCSATATGTVRSGSTTVWRRPGASKHRNSRSFLDLFSAHKGRANQLPA